MVSNRGQAAEAKVVGNFLERRRDAEVTPLAVDEIDDLLLSLGQVCHIPYGVTVFAQQPVSMLRAENLWAAIHLDLRLCLSPLSVCRMVRDDWSNNSTCNRVVCVGAEHLAPESLIHESLKSARLAHHPEP